jgi:hypothetical protein
MPGKQCHYFAMAIDISGKLGIRYGPLKQSHESRLGYRLKNRTIMSDMYKFFRQISFPVKRRVLNPKS